ncbi:DedA family protein [Deinococcus marmoris]|uniref:DedA family protein n=1 Tax=Deinococcus marmoris TaxID=249408 RepID=A0A1U7P0E9_9DEIO|nr:DedA family protein [Deinococcus marmoris]OLV17292.1 DedA family protein [Deinococcus marmoris]OLV18647.1 DedA protein [Deinococcus marmoris]
MSTLVEALPLATEHGSRLWSWLSSLDPAVLNLSTFGLMALEGAGIPGIPGVIPMLAQAAAIDAGHTTLTAALIWGVLGNWLGSLLGYAVARWGAHLLPARWLKARSTQRAAQLLERWGAGLVIVSRTVGSLRTPVTLLAGLSHYPLPKYTLLSLLGAAVHVGVWQTILWKFGPQILPKVGRWGVDLAIGAVLLVLVIWGLKVYQARDGVNILERGEDSSAYGGAGEGDN